MGIGTRWAWGKILTSMFVKEVDSEAGKFILYVKNPHGRPSKGVKGISDQGW